MDTKNTPVGFALVKITTEQFATIDDNLPKQGAEMGIEANFKFSISEEKKIIGVFANFAFQSEGKQFLIVEGGCHFKIKSEDWKGMLSNGQSELTISYGLLRHLATITVGTTRGILHAKTENTCFNKYHLPTINVIEMISDDLVIKCNQEML